MSWGIVQRFWEWFNSKPRPYVAWPLLSLLIVFSPLIFVICEILDRWDRR